IGGYAFGLTQFHLAPNLWLCMLASAVAAGIAGAPGASLLSPPPRHYYSPLTPPLSEGVFFLPPQLPPGTPRQRGVHHNKRLPVSLGPIALSLQGNLALYYFALAVFAMVVWLLWRLVRSPFGNTLQAIRQNDLRAAFLGYDVWRYKWMSLTLSAAISGLAG